MKQRNRDKRSARKEVQAMKRGENTSWGDYMCHEERILEDSPLPLKDGSRLDLNQPWEVPQQQEK